MTAAPLAFSTTLIDAAAVQQRLVAGWPLAVIDVSFDLAHPLAGESAYATEHLPAAHYLHLERDLCGATTDAGGKPRGRHPLPDRAAFAATIGRLGITPQTQVVAYDRHGAMFAARLWWMLRWLGHAPVAVLDGGLAAWQAAGGSLESGAAAVGTKVFSGSYPIDLAPPPWARTIDADALQSQLQQGAVALIDARAPERFRGEVEPLDAQAGHIPGARNRFFKDNLAADGGFKSAGALRSEFAALLGPHAARDVVSQCGSGVTACHHLLAMAVAGLDGATLYPGSWSEWSADPARPVARG
jgi:thiosulfate/3-mercaptopyruvate sulfurtransferase